jgi:4'-phosphopantetheinyl transferase
MAMGAGIDVVVASLAAAPECVRATAALLSSDERERAQRLVHDRDRRRFIMGRARLRELLGERLGIPPATIQFEYGDYGKPSIRARADRDLRFNIAHSDDLAVYAFADGVEVGIDVERMRVVDDADRLAHRFSPHERRAYNLLRRSDRPLGFLNCWTRKEAFIKATGQGLAVPLDSFDVSLEPGKPAEILRVGTSPGSSCGWRLQSFGPARGFIAALVHQQPS